MCVRCACILHRKSVVNVPRVRVCARADHYEPKIQGTRMNQNGTNGDIRTSCTHRIERYFYWQSGACAVMRAYNKLTHTHMSVWFRYYSAHAIRGKGARHTRIYVCPNEHIENCNGLFGWYIIKSTLGIIKLIAALSERPFFHTVMIKCIFLAAAMDHIIIYDELLLLVITKITVSMNGIEWRAMIVLVLILWFWCACDGRRNDSRIYW